MFTTSYILLINFKVTLIFAAQDFTCFVFYYNLMNFIFEMNY